MTPSHTLQRRALGGFAWMLTGTGGQALLRLALMLVLARLIGPEAFGIAGAPLAIVQIGIVFADLGVGSALAQRRELERRHVVAAASLAFGAGLLVALAIAGIAPFVELFFGFPDLLWITLALAAAPLLASLGTVADGLLRRELRFRAIAAITVASYALGYGVVGVGTALFGAGPWALALAFVAERGARAALSIAARPHPMPGRTDRSALREIAAFSAGMTLRRAGHQLAEGLDNIIVGRALGAEALGLYGRAYQLVSAAPATIGRALNVVAMPVMARIQDDPAALRWGYLRTMGMIMLAGMPMAAVLVVLAPQIVALLLGEQWRGAVEPLRILAPGIVLRLMLQLGDALGTAAGGVYEVAWRQWAYAGAVLIGALVGSQWGVAGVAWAVLAAQSFAVALSMHLCLRLTRCA